ncbi:histone acetyltransferase p300-like isoform X1 [Polyodon spathula]|uniref:histone acetyltransferase p300-like isoform X1 n=1 Tax=Polyodon spathula TaxID=7913 RepID=UPI001B7D9659|nr:histone acetyltransferase p300-like isoform X1 [Polyodon spathula]
MKVFPSFLTECIPITEKVCEHYRPGILNAVHRVQDILSKMPTSESLDSLNKEISSLRVHSDQQSPAGVSQDRRLPVHPATGPGPQQETSGSVRGKNRAPGVSLDRPLPVHPATGPGPQQETSGSVRGKNTVPEHHPPPPMRMHSAESRTQPTNQQYAYCQNPPVFNPQTNYCYGGQPANLSQPVICITGSNVSGIQIGKNNVMHIQTTVKKHKTKKAK